jgi:hypothetical protein
VGTKQEGPEAPPERFVWVLVLHGSNVGRLQALGALVDFEFDYLVLGKRLEASPEDTGVMHEEILASILRDEPEALLVTEPLDSSTHI